MEDDTGASRPRLRTLRLLLVTTLWVSGGLLIASAIAGEEITPTTVSAAPTDIPLPAPVDWSHALSPGTLAFAVFLLVCSAFFSASEVAYFSLQKLHLAGMRESRDASARLAAKLMEQPGSLLTSILMGNSIVNVLLSVVLAAPAETLLEHSLRLPAAASYPLAIAITTGILVFFGEILPKVLVVRQSVAFATRVAPLVFVVDRLLAPLRNGVIAITGLLFRVTGFSRVRPAPFITDQEFKVLLSEGETSGFIQKDERQMIQAILELRESTVGDILVPRPDVIALPESATIGDARSLTREHGFARIPVYRDDIDHISGVLHVKDLLHGLLHGDEDKPIRPLVRKALFVPETMRVSDFVKAAQQNRKHLAIVVDEYGGTEGIVTLQDALREVVGDIEDDEEEPSFVALGEGRWRVEGWLPLDELEELTHVAVEDEEHSTVAGFVMDRLEKVPEVGDELELGGVRYRVERVEGKRVERVLVELVRPAESQEVPLP